MRNSSFTHTLVSGDEYFTPEFFPYVAVSLMRGKNKLVYFYDASDGESKRMYNFIKNRVWLKTLYVEDNYEEAFASFLDDVDFMFIPFSDSEVLSILFEGLIAYDVLNINVVCNNHLHYFISKINDKTIGDILDQKNIRLTILECLAEDESLSVELPGSFVYSRVSKFNESGN